MKLWCWFMLLIIRFLRIFFILSEKFLQELVMVLVWIVFLVLVVLMMLFMKSWFLGRKLVLKCLFSVLMSLWSLILGFLSFVVLMVVGFFIVVLLLVWSMMLFLFCCVRWQLCRLILLLKLQCVCLVCGRWCRSMWLKLQCILVLVFG